VVALIIPADFHAVGQWYEDFSQTTDEEVASLLAQARQLPVGAQTPAR
jgi:putative phosphoribosyl transferase